jgi:uncharacterized protein (TIGR02058 family)
MALAHLANRVFWRGWQAQSDGAAAMDTPADWRHFQPGQAASAAWFPQWKAGPGMALVRCITEMGMGVDVHGKDPTKAAKRAVSDAIRHSSLGFFRMLGKTPHDMLVDVTIAVPNPDGVDTAAVAKELPYGTVKVTAVKGGLEIPAEQGSDAILIANAAVIVSLDDGKA